MVELKTKYPPWFDKSVRNLLREKEAAHRRKKADPSAENLGRFSTVRAAFKRQAASKYRDYLLSLVRDFKDNPKRYWSFIKAIKSSTHVSPVLEFGGRTLRSDVERANCLNACFARKFSDPVVEVLPAAPELSAPGIDRFAVPHGRVAQLLRELSPHKACGPDGLSARILRECADELAVPIEILCEMSVSRGSFPLYWRRANVVSVHKKGSKKNPENYRPVSLLPICSKILERVVFENLLPACLPAIPPNQHGFLPGRSCVTNLSCFLNHCWSSISKGKQTDAIYTDFSSAFTSVNHTLLLHKLRYSFQITGLAHTWLTSYLSDRMQRVVLNGKHSMWTAVRSGVPEGSILGPLMFVCYVADIPKCIETDCLLYADDVKLFHRVESTEDVAVLQRDIDRLCGWAKTWKLKLNPSKCQCITFTLKSSPVRAVYRLDSHELTRCHEVRDLGVILDAKLTFAQHVDVTVRKCKKMMGMIMRGVQLPRCPRRVKFDHSALIAAYNAHVRSIAEYGSVVWSGAAVTHLARLERMQHRFLSWLASNTHGRDLPMSYETLLVRFGMCSLKSRFIQADLRLVLGLYHGRIDCPHLLSLFGLAVPNRRSRQSALFHVAFGRVNTVKSGLFIRIPVLCNNFLQKIPNADMLAPSNCIHSDVCDFARSQGAYI